MLVLLKKYQNVVNQILLQFFINTMNDSHIREMSTYALTGGKRLRSSLMLDTYLSTMNTIDTISDKVNKNREVDIDKLNINSLPKDICNFVVCVELLHNASIILDDLPSMDNDSHRRNRLSLHAKYGKSNANILAGYFIEQSFHIINMSFDINNKNKNLIVILPYIEYFKKQFIKEMMIATEGQNMDLNVEQIPNDNNTDYWKYYGSSDDVNLNLIAMKTAPFFVIGLCGGYLIARIQYCVKSAEYLDKNKIKIIMDRTKTRFNKIKEGAYEYSYGFQISDDILDIDNDENNDEIFNVNYLLNVGTKKAKKKMITSLMNWKKIMNKMYLWTDLMEELYEYIPKRKK
jgi:geranylgeranyl pyrophosphate synthase